MWLLRVAARRVRFESLKKLRAGATRAMAFSTEERGSPNDFDYKIYFSEFANLLQTVPKRGIIIQN